MFLLSTVLIVLCSCLNATILETNTNDLYLAFDKLFEHKTCLRIFVNEEVDGPGTILNEVLHLASANINIVLTFEEDPKYEPTGYISGITNLSKMADFVFKPQRTLLLVQPGPISLPADSQLGWFAQNAGLNVFILFLIFEDPLLGVHGPKLYLMSLGDIFDKFTSWRTFVLPEWRPSFEGRNFTVGVFDCPPYVYHNATHDCYDGIDCYLIDFIIKATAWPLAFRASPPNGYVDVVEATQTRLVDAGVCSLFQSFVQPYEVDLSYPYYCTCITFLVPKPMLLHRNWFAFLPFQMWTWVFLVSTILAISYIYAKVAQAPLAFSTLTILRFFTASGMPRFPQSDVLRYLLTLSALCSIVVTNIYMAFYAKSFQQPRHEQPIGSIQSMIEHNIGWGAISEADQILAKSCTTQRLSAIVERFQVFASVEELNERIRQKGFGIMVDRIGNDFLAYTDVLDDYGHRYLMVLNECYAQLYMGIILTRNSPLKDTINKVIAKVYEQGFVGHWVSKTKNNLYKDFEKMMDYFDVYSEDFGEFHVFDWEAAQGAFYFLMLGYLIAAVAFLCEIVLGK